MQKVTLKLNPDYKQKPPKVGLGTAIKMIIGQAVDAIPIPSNAKAAIKECNGCSGRAASLDALQERFLARLRARRRARATTMAPTLPKVAEAPGGGASKV